MKKSFKFFAVLATASLAFSCAKVVEESIEIEQPAEEVPAEEVFEYIFRISDENGGPTKTTLDENTVKWEENDQIGVYADGTTNKSGEITTLNPVVFPVYLTAALSAGEKVYCYYPYDGANDSKAANGITLIIPATQSGDFDAMPQVSLPYEVTADMASGTNNVDDIYFCNIGSVAQFLVYSSSGAYSGESVESITLNANTGLAGSVTFDLTAVDYSDPSTLATSGYASKWAKTTASPAIGTSTGDAGVANLVIAPGTYYGTIQVKTDKAKYTYTITEPNKITFNRSKIKKLALNLESANCERVEMHPVGEVFVPATSISAGDKVVLASGTSGAVAVLGVQQDNNRQAVDYTITDGAIISTTSIYPLTVGAGTTVTTYFTLYDPVADGYLYAASSSANQMKSEAAVSVDSEWEIVLDGESKATTLQATGSSNRKIMRYNSTSAIFSCYSSGQKDIYVFKKSTATLVSAANQDIAYTVTSVEIPYNVYNASGATTVSFKSNPGDCASNLAINEGTKKVTFDITANTGATRTIEVYITNNSITKTVSITQAAVPSKLVMGAITTTPDQNQIVFSWDAVSNATGYQVSIDGGSEYLTKQAATSYTWAGLDPLTEYTLYVKAIGDGGIFYLDSDSASKAATTLAPILSLPSTITWNKDTKTVSWTDTNTGAGTYGTDYKYIYTLDDGASTNDATTSTTAVLSINEATIIKIKAVALTESHRSSAFSSGTNCTFNTKKYYTLVTSTSALAIDGTYIIVNASHNGLGPFTTSTKVSPTDLSDGYDAVNDRFDSEDLSVASCAITLKAPSTSKTNTYSLKMSNNKYIIAKSGTDFGSPSTSVSNTNADWTFSFQTGNVCKMLNVGQSTRSLHDNGTLFGAYASISTENVYLYKLEN